MTIDGVNIWTYGFSLSEVSGLYNQPARKKTIKQTAVEAKDIEFKDDIVSVFLVGKFDNYTALITGVDSLLSVLREERSYSFSDYSKLIRGFVKGGVTVEVEMLIVKMKFKITGQ